jgi:chaperone BCS1
VDISLLLTGVLMAGVGTAVYQLKSIPFTLFKKIKEKFIYTVKVYQYDELFEMLELWLSKNHKVHYRDVEASVNKDVANPVFNSDKCTEVNDLVYKQEENTFIIKYDNKKIVISKSKEKIDKAVSIKDVYFRKYILRGFKAKDVIDTLLKEVIEYSKKDKDENSVKVYTNNMYGDWNPASTLRVKPINKTIISKVKKDFIMNDIDSFLCSEPWYLDTNISYKRGYCLYGDPGTGKTTLCLAIANYTKRAVYCLNLSSLENDSRLIRCFNDIPKNSILLIEDIDKVFSGRENIDPKTSISFSSLLNCLDGTFYKHGLITIITTNYIDKLDEALLRTGRMDVKIEITKPSASEVSEYLSIFYKQDVNVNYVGNLRMSDIQNICINNKGSIFNAINEIYKS